MSVDSESDADLWQRLVKVDKFCAVNEDDEALKFLADMSFCAYFGWGQDDRMAEIPKIVSITSDDDCHDSISDICEIRHCSVKNKPTIAASPVQNIQEAVPGTTPQHKHHPSQEAHPITPSQSPTSRSVRCKETDTCKGVFYDESIAENSREPKVVLGSRGDRPDDEHAKELPDGIPAIICGKMKKKHQSHHGSKRQCANEYPAVIYAKNKPSRSRWAYV